MTPTTHRRYFSHRHTFSRNLSIVSPLRTNSSTLGRYRPSSQSLRALSRSLDEWFLTIPAMERTFFCVRSTRSFDTLASSSRFVDISRIARRWRFSRHNWINVSSLSCSRSMRCCHSFLRRRLYFHSHLYFVVSFWVSTASSLTPIAACSREIRSSPLTAPKRFETPLLTRARPSPSPVYTETSSSSLPVSSSVFFFVSPIWGLLLRLPFSSSVLGTRVRPVFAPRRARITRPSPIGRSSSC